jgi:hypothetical protein
LASSLHFYIVRLFLAGVIAPRFTANRFQVRALRGGFGLRYQFVKNRQRVSL